MSKSLGHFGAAAAELIVLTQAVKHYQLDKTLVAVVPLASEVDVGSQKNGAVVEAAGQLGAEGVRSGGGSWQIARASWVTARASSSSRPSAPKKAPRLLKLLAGLALRVSGCR